MRKLSATICTFAVLFALSWSQASLAQVAGCEGVFASSRFVSEARISPRRDVSVGAAEAIKALAHREVTLEEVPPEHQSYAQIVVDQNGQPVRTRISVVLLHGLYNSANDMRPIADHLHKLGFNVVNRRLNGHYEKDQTEIRKTVMAEDWLQDAREADALARELGDEVIYIGHSTGALALTYLAVNNPAGVKGLVAFAPAYKVQTGKSVGALFLDMIGVSFTDARKRLITGHAGRQVSVLAKKFQELVKEAPDRLSQVRFLMFNTQSDATIDLTEARNFIDGLQNTALPQTHHREIVIPKAKGVAHDAITSPERNPSFKKQLRTIETFFELGEIK